MHSHVAGKRGLKTEKVERLLKGWTDADEKKKERMLVHPAPRQTSAPVTFR